MSDTPPIRPPESKQHRAVSSLVLLNTGDGKGKSSSAFGIVMRSIAQDLKVAVVQFVKSGKWNTGEERICREQLGVAWWAMGEGFTWDSSALTEDQAAAQTAWRHAQGCISSGAYGLVVLDELTYPVNWGWLSAEEVATAVLGRPEATSIVMTGRDAPPELIEVAHTVTEMRNIKHAYEQGIVAKKGIDH